MTHAIEIAEGYWNLLRKKTGHTNQEIEQLATLRYEHCKICTINNQPGLVNDKCVICKCFMPSKTRALSAKCPAGKW